MHFSIKDEIAAVTATYRALLGFEHRVYLYDVRLTRIGLDGEELEPRYARVLLSWKTDVSDWASGLCNAIASRGNPARIETVEIVRSYGAQVFVVVESIERAEEITA